MNILLIDPFYDTSHKAWAEGYKRYSAHDVDIISLPPRFWKWRMYASAIEISQQIKEIETPPDLIMVTDMMDLTLFKALLPKEWTPIPIILYFHENQLTYPWSATDPDVKLQRDGHYAFMNYTSALVADHVCFNSAFHMQSFLGALPEYISAFPDYRNEQTIEEIKTKSTVLYLGLDLKRFDPFSHLQKKSVPTILWNHRWEYDKNPEAFFNVLFRLKEEGITFQLIVTGSKSKRFPEIFDMGRDTLQDEIIHIGYAESFEAYASLLWQSDILPVTNNQDFFGISVVEAAYCGLELILPNRLTYPELYGTAQFYNSDEELYTMLKTSILEFPENQYSNQRETVEKYDWSHMIEEYDVFFMNDFKS